MINRLWRWYSQRAAERAALRETAQQINRIRRESINLTLEQIARELAAQRRHGKMEAA